MSQEKDPWTTISMCLRIGVTNYDMMELDYQNG